MEVEGISGRLQRMEVDGVSGEVVDAALKVHRALGPGLLESVYEVVLKKELERRNLRVERQRSVDFEFDGLRFENGFRIDLLVNDCVVVELKSVETLSPVHSKRLLTYLRLMNLHVGLLHQFRERNFEAGPAPGGESVLKGRAEEEIEGKVAENGMLTLRRGGAENGADRSRISGAPGARDSQEKLEAGGHPGSPTSSQ
jgi:iron complex transport system substrate-binding protein